MSAEEAAGATEKHGAMARLIHTSDRIAHAIATGCPPAAEIVRDLADPPQGIPAASLVDIVSAAAKWYAKVDELLLAPPAA